MLPVWTDDNMQDDNVTGSPLTSSTAEPVAVECNGDVCQRIPTDPPMAVSFDSLEQVGAIVTLFAIFRKMDDSVYFRNLQRVAVVAFTAASARYLFSLRLPDGPEPWWARLELSVAVPYSQLIPWLLPSCLAAVGTCCCCAIGSPALHQYQHYTSSLRASASPSTLRSRAASLVRYTGDWALRVIAVLWILLSAVPLQSVADITPWLPHTTLHMFNAVQSFKISNSYGLFRSMTGVGKRLADTPRFGGLPISKVSRPEIILEACDALLNCSEISFKYKPGDLLRPPPIVAPHQPRLDWQMWFAALSDYQHNAWLVNLVHKLLQGNEAAVRLLDQPNYRFLATPPHSITAYLYDYDFTHLNTTWFNSLDSQQGAPTQWWERRNKRLYLPELTLQNPSLESFLRSSGVALRPYESLEQQLRRCERLGGVTVRVAACSSLRLLHLDAPAVTPLIGYTLIAVWLAVAFRARAR